MSRFGLAVAATVAATAAGAAHAQPSFDCAQAVGSIQELICQHSELAAFDHKLAAVYRQAQATLTSDGHRQLDVDQADWIRGRNGCARYSQDPRGCLGRVYRDRIAELQARYQLVPMISRTSWICDGDPTNEVISSIYDTEPRAAVLQRGDRTITAWQQHTDSGTRFDRGNPVLWIKGDEATITWMGADMRCVARK